MKDWTRDKLIRVGIGWCYLDYDQICWSTKSRAERRDLWGAVKQGYRKTDVRLIIKDLQAAGVEVLYFHAKSHTGNVWFQSRIGHPFSLLGRRDFFGELVDGCRANGIIPVGMFQATHDARNRHLHPSWAIVGEDGKRSGYLCIHNPNWRRDLLGMIEEVVRDYDVAGICLDELRMSARSTREAGCYCRHCRKAFRAAAGKEIPAENWDDPLWRRFVAWRYSLVKGFLAEVRGLIKGLRADVFLTLVSYVTSKRDYSDGQRIEDLADTLDYINVDNAFSVNEAETAKKFRSFSARRAEIWTSGPQSLRIPGRRAGDSRSVKPYVEYMTEAMAIISNGMAVSMDTYQGTARKKGIYFQENLRQMIVDIAREVRRRKPWLTGDLEPIRHTAILYSERSRDFYGSRLGNIHFYNHEYLGMYNALWQGQVLCDVIGSRQLCDGSLDRYKALVLPNAYSLSDREAEAIRKFVRRGGGVVATYQTSLGDEQGRGRRDFALGDLFGVEYRDGVEDDYDFALSENRPGRGQAEGIELCRPSHPVVKGLSVSGTVFLWPTPVLRVRKTAATVVADAVRQRPSGSMLNSRTERTGNIGITARGYGKGKIVWFNSKIGCLWGITGSAQAKQLIINAVRYAGDEQPVRVEAPFCVEVNAYRDVKKNRLIVHLLNHQACPTCVADAYSCATRRCAKELIELADLKVRIDVRKLGIKPGRVYLAPGRKPLPFRLRNGCVVTTVPRLGIHRMVVIEGGGGMRRD